MFRRWGISISVAGALLVSAAPPGIAQVFSAADDPDLLRCANWITVGDKPETWRQMYIIELDRRRQMPGEIQTGEMRRHGRFDIPSEMKWAILSNASNEGIGFPLGDRVSVQFTLSWHDAILFYPEDTKRPIQANRGFLELSQAHLPKIRNIRPVTCIQSASMDAWEEAGSKLLSDLDSGRKTPDFRTESGRKPPMLSDLDQGKETSRTPAKPDTGEPASRDSANKDTKPAAPRPPAIASVCNADTLRPMSVAGIPKSLQAVGLRNNDAEPDKFDYHLYPEDVAVSLGATFNLADSQGKLVPYDTVARNGADLWVSLLGVEEPRPNAAAAKPESLVRIIVVGGPAEVAMSGLADVGAELKRLGAGRVKLKIEWHVVGPSGAIGSVGNYNSFDKLAEAVAAKAAGSSPDLLNEEQLRRLLDDFEGRLKARTEPVEKVFWIKGAYSIPSSIPLRFEKFIKAVSSSEAIAGGSGRSSKWFVLVTARMTGFSINYLKEPIYSLQIGDLIEEDDTAIGQPRRFIKDTMLWATRLQLAAVPMPAQTPSAVTGKLVLRAGDVFEQRGYLLSLESLRGLQSHLKLVVTKWEELAASRENLAAWAATKGRKLAPTVVDLLQSADDAASQLRLPRILPDWARKAIRDLTSDEAASARTFIEGYMDGVDRSVAGIDGKGDRCRLFYASEEALGFTRP
jgi:hypothetical protein